MPTNKTKSICKRFSHTSMKDIQKMSSTITTAKPKPTKKWMILRILFHLLWNHHQPTSSSFHFSSFSSCFSFATMQWTREQTTTTTIIIKWDCLFSLFPLFSIVFDIQYCWLLAFKTVYACWWWKAPIDPVLLYSMCVLYLY